MVPTTWLFDERTLLMSDAGYRVCVSGPNKTDACVKHGHSGSPGGAANKNEVAKQKRISEEESRYKQGFPVAGHDPRDRER
jgi:hypothetical protein